MTTKELSEILSSAQTATSLSGLSMLCVDSSNALALIKSIRIYPGVQDWNVDNIKETCIFSVPTEQVIAGGGMGGASILNIVTPYGTRFQLIMKAGSGGNLFFRAYSANSQSWQGVQKITMTAVS